MRYLRKDKWTQLLERMGARADPALKKQKQEHLKVVE